MTEEQYFVTKKGVKCAYESFQIDFLVSSLECFDGHPIIICLHVLFNC